MCNLICNLQVTYKVIIGPQMYYPTKSYFADDFTLLSCSPTHVDRLYEEAMLYCQVSGARLHPQESKDFTATPLCPHSHHQEIGIEVLESLSAITILGVPMGTSMTREVEVHRITQKIIQKGPEWWKGGRTLQSRAIILFSVILSVIWYVLGAIFTIHAEIKHLLNVADVFIQRMKGITCGYESKRRNVPRAWMHAEKSEGDIGIPTINANLKKSKLALLRTCFAQRAGGESHTWHSFAYGAVWHHKG